MMVFEFNFSSLQDEIGGSYSASETFVGKLAYFDIWDRVVHIQEIHEFFSTCIVTPPHIQPE